MSITAKNLKILKRRLPKAAVPMAVERLRDKGTPMSPSYLYMILKRKRYNALALEVLADIADEHEAHSAKLNARIAGNKTC